MAQLSEADEQYLREQMIQVAIEQQGEGFTRAYYDSLAGEYAEVAGHFARQQMEMATAAQPRDWTLPEHGLPPEDTPVWALLSDGQVAEMARKGGLWYYPGTGMHCYFTPKFWQPKA